MAIKFTRPEVDIREKLNSLDKPSSAAGEALLRANTPQEQFNLIGAGRKNLIINGDMQINQRGTVTGINSATTNYGGPDRHAFYVNANGAAFTVSQEASGPPGFPNTYLIDCTTANSTALTATQEIKTQYVIEAYDIARVGYGTSQCSPITISFWCKTNQKGNFVVWLYREDGTRTTSLAVPIHAADTWEFKKVTFQPDPNNTVAIDNTAGMYVSLILNTGSGYTSGTSPNGKWETIVTANRYVGCDLRIGDSTDDYFEYTGFQVEMGKIATPFEHRSYGEELSLCRRYYYKRGATVSGDRFCSGNASSTTDFRGFIEFPVEMRANPTFETSGTASHFSIVTGTNGVVTCNDVPTAGLQKWGGLINAETASGLTAGHGGQLRAASTSAYIAVSAEL